MARPSQRSRIRTVHLPAPIGGINTVSPGTDMPASDCIYCYNLIGGEYGLRTRLGWREWVTGLDGSVRSLLPFSGSTKDGAASRLFACTESGIWDVSASTGTPTRVVEFETKNVDSGWGISTAFTDLNGGHWLVYTDEANGYYTYSEATATWVKVAFGTDAGQISGVDPSKFVYVLPWKNRLWFVERDTQRAWYLGLNALYGEAKPFAFGSRFKAGGDLRGLWSWTYDGGSGIDDRLVAVSGGGDVVIYQGTDPASASTFSIVGVWFVGAVPAGRNLATDNGGELLLMSSMGILPLSRLTSGAATPDQAQYQTTKIANLFGSLQAATSSLRGWAMRLHPADAALVVLVPQAVNQPSQQLVMSLTTKGWHQYRGMPMGACAEPWGGRLYFGTEDGCVGVNTGDVDGVLLSDANAYTPIEWSVLTSFGNLGSSGQKIVQFIRVLTTGLGGAISYQATARYAFDFAEAPGPGAATAAAGALWDSAVWDQDVWGGSYQAAAKVFGASGMGAEVAIAARGASTARTVLVSMDAGYEEGGVL